MILAGVMTLQHLDGVGTFQDGDRLDLPGHPAAVHTPGHTEGHTKFHCPERGLLFTGDGLITMDLIGSDTGPQMIEKRFNLDHDLAVSSLDRIVDLEAVLLPGHGRPWEDSPAEAVALLRSERSGMRAFLGRRPRLLDPGGAGDRDSRAPAHPIPDVTGQRDDDKAEPGQPGKQTGQPHAAREFVGPFDSMPPAEKPPPVVGSADELQGAVGSVGDVDRNVLHRRRAPDHE